MRKKVKRFVHRCNKYESGIRDIIMNMSLEEKIFLKANIKEKIVHSEKKDFIIYEGTFLVSMIALIVSLGVDLRTVFEVNIIKFVLVFFGVTVIWCCFIQNTKAKYAKALSYLEDFGEVEIRVLPPKAEPDLSVETFEQTRERYTKEIEQKISELDEKRAEIDRQSEMWEAILKKVRDVE